MKYQLNENRSITIPDKEIEKLQNTLKISKDEAIQTWLVDEGYELDQTVEELSEKAKKNRISATIHEAKAINSQKKEKKSREKKENPIKKEIIKAIFLGLKENLPSDVEFSIVNDEKYIEINGYNHHFTINLIQHRDKKE